MGEKEEEYPLQDNQTVYIASENIQKLKALREECLKVYYYTGKYD